MQKWIETTGRNENDAVAVALAKLGLDRDEVSVEVIERAKSGFLGIGGNPAKVRVSYGSDEEELPVVPAAPVFKPAPRPAREERAAKPAAQEEKPRVSTPAARPAPAPVSRPAAHPATRPARPVDPNEPDVDRSAEIMAFLSGLMERMGVVATPSIRRGEDGSYKVDLLGDELGSLIGRRGETLDAIQQITSYAVNKSHVKRARIHIDCEHYRAKREESLENLARRVADKVVKYRRNTTLEPMNAYERHVIHTALQDYPNITTYSTGTEPNRRTVVAYSKGEHQN